jgi:hypothetical protein
MPCLLVPVPDSTDFQGPADAPVTLLATDHIGSVMVAKAEYAGDQLIEPGTAVSSFTLIIKPGRNTLKLVFVFTAGFAGRGELREEGDDGNSQFLRDLAGDEPLQVMRIIGV